MRSAALLLATAAVLLWRGCPGSAETASATNRDIQPETFSATWVALSALGIEADADSRGRGLLHRGSHRRQCASLMHVCTHVSPPLQCMHAHVAQVCHRELKCNTGIDIGACGPGCANNIGHEWPMFQWVRLSKSRSAISAGMQSIADTCLPTHTYALDVQGSQPVPEMQGGCRPRIALQAQGQVLQMPAEPLCCRRLTTHVHPHSPHTR